MSAQTATQTTTRADLAHHALRRELLRLARHEDEAASQEAARVHYWEPTPVTVVVHRRCAAALRDAADEHFRSDRRPGTAGPDQQRQDLDVLRPHGEL